MKPIIKRKIVIENRSQRTIRVVIEPTGDERTLTTRENVSMELTLRDEADLKDDLTIDYHDNAIVLFEEGDIDIEFLDKNGP
ncbi:hypothetical protein [Labrys miyagiensis]